MLEATVNTDLPLSESLGQLQDSVDRIFDTISKRVTSEHQQLKDLSERIVSAQAKVDAISGTKRATKIYSSAKYPRADPSVADFVSLFEDGEQNDAKARADTVSLDSGQWQSQEEGTLELFQFFSETSHEYRLKHHTHKDGFGKVSPGIKSIADLLLFNSTELPYHKYKVVDSVAGSERRIVQEELDVRPIDLPPAPHTVLTGDVVPGPGSDEFGFRPILRQIPSFSLPPSLPDLPMVADISWSGMLGGIDQLPSIAPSAIPGGPYSPRSNYSVSPRFDSTSASVRFDPPSASARLDYASDNSSIQGEKEVPSRALPPLHMPAASAETTAQSVPTRSGSDISSTGSANSLASSSLRPQSITVDVLKAQTPQVAPPPPPPPPPPPTPPSLPGYQSSPARGSQSGRKSSTLPALPPVDSQRAELMASIRNSGLDLLRKTPRSENSRARLETPGLPLIGRTGVEVPENIPEGVPEKLKSPEVKQPMNLMAEMAKSLTLRRLSMQGEPQVLGPTTKDKQDPSSDEGQQSVEQGRMSALTLPSLGAYITEKNEDQSDADDDDDEWD